MLSCDQLRLRIESEDFATVAARNRLQARLCNNAPLHDRHARFACAGAKARHQHRRAWLCDKSCGADPEVAVRLGGTHQNRDSLDGPGRFEHDALAVRHLLSGRRLPRS